MTNQVKTINIGGAAYKVITSIPGISDLITGGSSGGNPVEAYTVPLVFRCTKLISDSGSSVRLRFYSKGSKDEKEKDSPFPGWNVSDWTWKTIASLLAYGAAYSVILKNQAGRTIGLQWMNPSTMSVEFINGQKVFKQTGTVVGGQKREWTSEEMFYLREFSFKDDYSPGISATQVAIPDAYLIRYLTRFASQYFEGGAMPVTLLPMNPFTPDTEVKRLEGVFRSLMTGLRRAWGIIGIKTGETKPFTLTPPLKDLVMPPLYQQARRAVTEAFGVPQTMVEDAANYATAKEHRLSFWQDTVKPFGRRIADGLNEQVFGKMALRSQYAYDELEIFQEDEADRAASLAALVGAGMPLDMAMDRLGYEMTDAERVRLQNLLKPVVAPAEPTQKDIRSALFQWKRVALASINSGHSANVEFDNPLIDDDLADVIREGLSQCRSANEIHSVFAQARQILKGVVPEVVKPDSGDDKLADELKRATDLLLAVIAKEEGTTNV